MNRADAYGRFAALSRSDSHADRVLAQAEAGAYNDVFDALTASADGAREILFELVRAGNPLEAWQIGELSFGFLEDAVEHFGHGTDLLTRLVDLEPKAGPVRDRYLELHP